MKVLDALLSWQLTNEVKSPVYFTNRIYRDCVRNTSGNGHNDLSDSLEECVFFPRRANIRTSMKETVAAFSRQSKKQQ